MLHAGLKINGKMAPFVMVVHRMLDIHVYAAKRVYHLLGRVNVQHQIVRGIGA